VTFVLDAVARADAELIEKEEDGGEESCICGDVVNCGIIGWWRLLRRLWRDAATIKCSAADAAAAAGGGGGGGDKEEGATG
jgi:hypothetical protein